MAINLSKIKFSSLDEVSVIISPKQTNSETKKVTFYDLSGNRVTKIPSGKRDIAIRNKCYLGLKAYKNSERWEPVDPNEVDKYLNDSDFKVAHSLSEDNKQPQKRTSEEKLEDEIQAKIEENRSFRKYGKWIFPALLIFGIILISVDWTVTGWIILIGNLLYLGALWQSPTNYADVKNSILEERQKEKEEKEEKERLEKEKQENIKRYGCSFENTELIKDDFSDKVIITTKLYGKFKQSLLESVDYVNQSSQLHYNHFEMKSVNINIETGMWASVKLEQSKGLKKYLLEFHFLHETRTKDKDWSSQPSAESCVLDIVAGGETYNFPVTVTQNDKKKYDYNLLESSLSTRQTFHFEVSEDLIKHLRKDFKIRLSNFQNMGKNNSHMFPIGDDFISNLRALVNDFCNDLGMN